MKASAVLIYDGDCRFCRGGLAWIKQRAIPGSFEFLPCQSEARKARLPLISEETCMQAMQLVLPDGQVLAGAQAIPEILRRLRRWRWAVLAFRLPGIGLVAPLVYAWVSRNRYALSCWHSSNVGKFKR